MPGLNLSRGRSLAFAADGVPINGVIVSSRTAEGLYARVVVETDAVIRSGAHLTILESECGGCGLASPRRAGNRTKVELEVSYGCIDASTIGK